MTSGKFSAVSLTYTNKKLCYHRPHNMTCQLNSCQLLHNSVGTTCTTSSEQIEVMELEGYSRSMYNKLVHLAMTRSTVVGVIRQLAADEFVDNT